MDTCELVTSITAIACTIVKNYSKEEAALMVAVFTQLADTIDTILTKQELCSNENEK